MCGICGFNWEDKVLVKKMCDKLIHRGPDQQGIYLDKGISLGHTRLSILDLSERGRQPMTDKEGEIVIIFNGEIYNYRELKEEHLSEFDFKSKTDTEVLIYMYKKFGKGLLKHINGRFAFCIYDRKKKMFFLARDRLGMNPLYYYWDKKKFIFASELKAIIEDNEIVRKVDMDAVYHYLQYGYTPQEGSILEGIKKLPPAHFMEFDLKRGEIRVERYWELDFSKKIQLSEKEIMERIRQLMSESVKKRLIADVPVGAFLSGGIDSSIVCSEIVKFKENLKTFSIGFDYPDFSEEKYAILVSELLQTDHHQIEFNGEHVRDLIPTITHFYDEPLGDPSIIPTFLVSKIAREKVTVCLSGDGGDESFGGYTRYPYTLITRHARYVPNFIIKGVGLVNSDLKRTTAKIIEAKNKKIAERCADFISLMPTKVKSMYYLDRYFKYKDLADNLFNSDINTVLPEDILVKVDRASMANSLETRTPILDHEFLEFSARLPSNYKVRGLRTKYVLKKAYKGVIPDEVLFKKKRGFVVPMVHYFRKDLKDLVLELPESRVWSKLNIDPLRVQKAVSQHIGKKEDNSIPIWVYMMLDRWYKEYIELG